MNGIKLRGTGRCVPANTVTNDDLSRLVDTNDEWITARTGIRSRCRCEKETLTELCVSAARDALHMAGITPAPPIPVMIWLRSSMIPARSMPRITRNNPASSAKVS